MEKHTITDVSDTALWVAVYRALESERPDRLFNDPLAARLAGERGSAIANKSTSRKYISWSVVIRTCIIDKYIQEQIAQGVDTVINLGAGLDTRPYRLNLPKNLHWIEVDYPHMIQLKEINLANETPHCHLERVRMDLSDREARQQLFKRVNSQATNVLVLTEGVVPYLSNVQVATLADDLRAQENFRHWIVDYFSNDVIRYILRGRMKKQMQNAPFKFSPQDWYGFFDLHGWKVEEKRYMSEESEKLGRKIPMPGLFQLIRFFLSRKKQQAAMRSTGYFLLRPH